MASSRRIIVLRYVRTTISPFGHIGKSAVLCFPQPMRRVRHLDRVGLHLRVVLDGAVAMGPGKVELLEAIVETGSIAAAGRRMGMSYKRAWLLVEQMNAMFTSPLVGAAKGGAGGGGATLTPLGQRMLTAYRDLEAAAAKAGARELAAMRRALAHH
jgi:molybdate transport system regulatory protein